MISTILPSKSPGKFLLAVFSGSTLHVTFKVLLLVATLEYLVKVICFGISCTASLSPASTPSIIGVPGVKSSISSTFWRLETISEIPQVVPTIVPTPKTPNPAPISAFLILYF